jgi:prepilin-type N-terminal cleavage/methylation domain-containing protein
VIARLIRLVRRSGGTARRDDAGFSLMEVMVGAGIMSVVMAVATGGFLSMYQTTDKAESGALAQTQLSAAFGKLDHEVRYAYRVNDAYTSDGDFGISYVIPDSNNKMLCVQLTLPAEGGTLLRTQWVRSPEAGQGYELTTNGVATNLISGRTAQDDTSVKLNPFLRKSSDAESNFDRLQLTVDSTVGLGNDKGSVRNYDLTFTALNTQGNTIDLSCVRP